jgi:hypothetical protein
MWWIALAEALGHGLHRGALRQSGRGCSPVNLQQQTS